MRVALLLLLLLLVVLLLLTVLPQMDAGRLRVGGGRYKAVGAMELVVGGISLALVLGVGDCSAAAPQGFSVFDAGAFDHPLGTGTMLTVGAL